MAANEKMLKSIYDNCVDLKVTITQLAERQNSMLERIEGIEEKLNPSIFTKMLDDQERNLGNYQGLINIIYKEYGDDKNYAGHELLEKIFHDYANKLEIKKDFKKAFIAKIFNLLPVGLVSSGITALFMYIVNKIF